MRWIARGEGRRGRMTRRPGPISQRRSLFHRRRDGGRSRRRSGRGGIRLSHESLEERRVMATLYWDPDGIPGNNNVATGAGLGAIAP